MPRFYVRQPDGRFAIFSTVVDNFIVKDLTRAQLIEARIKEETVRITEELNYTLDYLEDKNDGHNTLNVMLWKDAVDAIVEE